VLVLPSSSSGASLVRVLLSSSSGA
jgi:hypothetical protein